MSGPFSFDDQIIGEIVAIKATIAALAGALAQYADDPQLLERLRAASQTIAKLNKVNHSSDGPPHQWAETAIDKMFDAIRENPPSGT